MLLYQVPFKSVDDIKESPYYTVDNLPIKFGVFRLRKYGAKFGLNGVNDDYVRNQ